MLTILLVTITFMVLSGVLLTHLDVKRSYRKRREYLENRVRNAHYIDKLSR